MKTHWPILLLLAGCALNSGVRQVDDQELMQQYQASWFTKNDRHTLLNAEGKPSVHMFYDISPEFSRDFTEVNAVLTTPQNSEHAYDVDLGSGQRHYSHSYCSQKDIWKQVGGSFYRPPFSIGYMPRVLDQLGTPQKVIIFSQKDMTGSLDTNYQRIRLIAAYVEQTCREGNCTGKNNWLSRLVFIGIDASDSSLSKVQSLEDFHGQFKWNQMKAHLENMDGRSFIGDKTYPLTRINKVFPHTEAVDYFKKNSIFLSPGELRKIQTGCFALYDRLWKEVGEERPEDRASKTVEQLNEKLQVIEELRKKSLPVGFAERFRVFAKKYYNEMSTCQKYVYPGNINGDPEVFWFYTYVGMFFRLHKEGHYFDCGKGVWQRNIFDRGGELVHNLINEIDQCSDRDLDVAMSYLPHYVKGLKLTSNAYRFVDYDNRAFGTHRKLYSWVKSTAHRYDCAKDPNVEISKSLEVFPADVSWKNRNVVDIKDELKIIH